MAPKLESFEQTVYFRCRPQHIYDALTEQRAIQTYTQAPSVIDLTKKTFSLFDGSITGEFVELEPPHHIREKWRQKTWEPNVYSDVDITIKEVSDGVTKVVLKHSKIPHDDAYGNHDQHEKCAQGWEQFFWQRIDKVLGYARIQEDDLD